MSREPEYCQPCSALYNDEKPASEAFRNWEPIRHEPGNHLYARLSDEALAAKPGDTPSLDRETLREAIRLAAPLWNPDSEAVARVAAEYTRLSESSPKAEHLSSPRTE